MPFLKTYLAIVLTGLALTGLPAAAADIYAIPLVDIDGKPTSFARYKGHPVLVVNTASLCGLTGQYAGLQKLYRDYKDRGFKIAAFPANDFRSQEPGSNEDIKEFCVSKYAIQFDLYEKIVAKAGPDQHVLFRMLTEGTGEGPSWNFTKYLVDREGRIVQRFSPRTKPEDKEIVAAIEKLLP